MLRDLPTEQIARRADARAVNPDTVSGLVESIGAVGLINPIRVRQSGEGWEVIAGVHRLEACKELGLAEVTCDVVADDDLHAELAMIDENLCRAELSPSDRARQTARRKSIYEELNGPAKANSARAANAAMGRGDVNEQYSSTFVASTAAMTGQSERVVQLNAERGQKILPEVLDLIRGTSLDTVTYLDKLKKMPGSEQFNAATRDLSFLNKRDRQNERAKDEAAKRSKIQSDVKSRAAKEVAGILAEHVPGEWWDAVRANLYAAGASNIAHEFTNITGHSIIDRGAA
jgi:hypothetical protein